MEKYSSDFLSLVVHNTFLFPWKVPSMNELVFAKGVTGKTSWLLSPGKKKKNPHQFNMYNQLKQDWASKVDRLVRAQGFSQTNACYFHYLVIENTVKRDPSNICASAVKFIEDGLIKAKVIPNDGWKNVLGIRTYWILDRDADNSVFLVMANQPLSQNAIESYYNEWKNNHKV